MARHLNARLAFIAAAVAVIWAISVVGFVYPALVYELALTPRDTSQWWGILTSAFVHRDLTHLLANTAPLVMFLLLLQSKGGTHFYAAVTRVCVVWVQHRQRSLRPGANRHHHRHGCGARLLGSDCRRFAYRSIRFMGWTPKRTGCRRQHELGARTPG